MHVIFCETNSSKELIRNAVNEEEEDPNIEKLRKLNLSKPTEMQTTELLPTEIKQTEVQPTDEV